MKITKSLVHRLFRIVPGSVPTWLCCTRSCDGVDCFELTGAALFLGGALSFSINPLLAALLFGMGFVLFSIYIPFHDCERKARRFARDMAKKRE